MNGISAIKTTSMKNSVLNFSKLHRLNLKKNVISNATFINGGVI